VGQIYGGADCNRRNGKVGLENRSDFRFVAPKILGVKSLIGPDLGNASMVSVAVSSLAPEEGDTYTQDRSRNGGVPHADALTEAARRWGGHFTWEAKPLQIRGESFVLV